MKSLIRSFQDNLWEQARSYQLKDADKLKEAFMLYPRHKFITHFSPDHYTWITLHHGNIFQHLDLLYADTTLLLYDKGGYVSTISQPSLVIKMLDMLDVKPGMRIFELGTGSGWNAAMLGHLTGPEGRVVTVEIIEEMAEQAKHHLSQFQLPQVEVRAGDAQIMIEDEEPFERGVFTAGAFDLPLLYFDKIVEGGKLLFVLKTGTVDLLLLLRKEGDHFQEIERLPCLFVPVKGKTPHSRILGDEIFTNTPLRIYPKNTQGLHEQIVSRGETCIYTQSA